MLLARRPNSEHVTVTHCNGTNPLHACIDPKLKAGDRNLRQRLQNSMGTAFQRHRRHSWKKAKSLHPVCQMLQKHLAQNNTSDLHGARPNPSNDVGTTSIDVGNDVPGYLWKRVYCQPRLSFPFLRATPGYYDGEKPVGTHVTLYFARFGNASSAPYHDNPRQSHARTQCAPSFSSPPLVRASTQYISTISTKHDKTSSNLVYYNSIQMYTVYISIQAVEPPLNATSHVAQRKHQHSKQNL